MLRWQTKTRDRRMGRVKLGLPAWVVFDEVRSGEPLQRGRSSVSPRSRVSQEQLSRGQAESSWTSGSEKRWEMNG